MKFLAWESETDSCVRTGVHSGGKRVVVNATIDKYEHLPLRTVA